MIVAGKKTIADLLISPHPHTEMLLMKISILLLYDILDDWMTVEFNSQIPK